MECNLKTACNDELLANLVDNERAARLRKSKPIVQLMEKMPDITEDAMVAVANSCGFLFAGDPGEALARLQELADRSH